MKPAPHGIGVLTWEVGLDDPERVQKLQEVLSDLNRITLTAIMEQCFSDAAPPGTHVVLDKLELDLGAFRWEQIGEELPSRLRKCLREALPSPGDSPPDSTAKSSEGGFPLDAFRLYLERGVLPWWAEQADGFDAESLLEDLLEDRPGPLKKVLLDLGRHSGIRKRVSLQFHEASLIRIVELLEPQQAPWIIRYAEDWQEHQEKQPVLPTDTRTFRAVKWEFILTYLLVDRGSVFNTKMFVRSTLESMASHFHLDYTDLLGHLHAALQNQAFPRNRRYLTEIIRELREEAPASRSPSTFPKTKPHRQSGRAELTSIPALQDKIPPAPYELFQTFLEQGQAITLPEKTAREALEDTCSVLFREEPARVRRLLRKIGRKPSIPARLALHLTEPHQELLVAAVEPDHGRTIVGYSRQLSRTHAQRPFSPVGPETFRQIKWQVIWRHLLGERGSAFNTKSFLKSILSGIARHHNLTYGQVLSDMVWSLQSGHVDPVAPVLLFEHLLDLQDEWQDAHDRKRTRPFPIPPGPEATPIPPAPEAVLRSYLRSAHANTTVGEAGTSGLEKAVMTLARTSPGLLVELLGHPAHLEKKRGLLRLLSESAHSTLLTVLLPGHSAFFSCLQENMPDTKTRTAVLEFMADALFPARPLTAFSPKEWDLSLRRSARRHLLPEQFLLARALEESPHLPPHAPLGMALREIAYGTHPPVPEDLPAGTPPPLSLVELLEYGLRKGSFPPGESSGFASLAELIETMSVRSPLSLADVLRRADDPDQTADLLARVLPPSRIARILEILEPEKARWIKTLAEIPALLLKSAQARSYPIQLTETEARILGRRLLIAQTLRKRAPRPLRFFIDYLERLAPLLKQEAAQLHDWLDSAFEETSPNLDGPLKLLAREHRDRRQKPRREQRPSPPGTWPPQQALEYYLHFGFFPFGTASDEPATLASLIEQCLAPDRVTPPGLRARIQDSCVSFDLVRRKQFHLLEMLWKGDSRLKALPELRHFFRSAPFHALPAEEAESWFWVIFLEKIRHKPPSEEAFLRVLLESLFVKALRRMGGNADELAEQLSETARKAAPSSYSSRFRRDIQEAATLLKTGALRHRPPPPPKSQARQEPVPKPQAAAPFQEHQAVHLKNAGLILLWPFLRRLWETLGLMQTGRLVNEEARQRAVFVLQFLAAGHTRFSESSLVLNKILCGLRPEAPLCRDRELTLQERNTCETLLEQVILHWDKLGQTSPQGLRGSFLCRQGVLHETETEWVLRVEQKGYDILLGFLPWQITTVKTSWMEKPIQTHWFR